MSEKYYSVIEKLRRLRDEITRIALDEDSEAIAYSGLAAACKEGDERWRLFIVALDSILHREIAWAIVRATYEVEALARELAEGKGRLPLESIGEELRKHLSIESIAESSYKDVLDLAVPGTTLYKLIKLLSEEEEKHQKIVLNIISKVGKS